MADSTSTQITVSSRTPGHSRDTRRLRREGRVPGTVYGGGQEPSSFSVDARELRLALHGSGAVLDLSIDGGKAEPAVLKDAQRHPVRNEIIHIDLLRVDLDQAIHAIVSVELAGAEDAPGIKSDGGILEHVTRELNIEALPTEIPESIIVDVSAGEVGDTITMEGVPLPDGVILLDDPAETVIASISAPRLANEIEEADEIETETEVVGEEGEEGEEAPASAEE
jgi:large subunit ribosomal protein L25